MNVQFGTGVLYALPNAANLATNPTPYRFGVLQEAQVDFKGDLKKLYGQYQFALAKARGKIDVTVKSKLAVLDPNMLNQLYFAQNAAAGITLISDGEPWTVGQAGAAAWQATHAYTAGQTIQDGNSNLQLCVAGGTSGSTAPSWKTVAGQYTVDGAGGLVWQMLGPASLVVTVANNTTFVTDYGVQYAGSGQQLTKVASGPAAGQYAPSGGSYTFAAADAGAPMLISYTYTASTRGATVTLTNQPAGYAPEFRALLYNLFHGRFFGLELFSCQASEISVPTKLEDFWIVDFNFEAACDATNTLGKLYADLA
jgi:hypothetical protein